MLQKLVAGAMEKDAEQAPGAQSPQASVISTAILPIKPVAPKKVLILILTVCGSALLGVVLAILVELMDATYRTGEQIEHELGIPVLSYVPKLPRRGTARDLHNVIAGTPFSASAEAVRSVRARLAALAPAAKTLAFGSSEPQEGKSTLAIAVATMGARAGRRVVLVDADIRMSVVTQMLGLKAERGLVDVLLDAVPIEQVVQHDAVSGADVVPARRSTARARDAEAFTAKPRVFEDVLAGLRLHYDLVVIDTPPACTLVDAQIIAAAADVSVMVVAWGQTSRKSVQTAINALRAPGTHVAGVVFNKVDASALAHYTEGEAGYCNKRYHRYYTAAGGEA
jgi:capsular exopolysaccharide synthesis family protein